ncbi:AAEL014625-PA [Aedes aegypti]|uniref:AAEL014625-PA n=1 Tax=Aedes aegypti TaxID=7159 RepID=Q16FV4_AEDAE|nr:AAEL014625-PA [Aedes aegypti]
MDIGGQIHFLLRCCKTLDYDNFLQAYHIDELDVEQLIPISVSEGIDDVQTFMDLNDNDFTRLHLKTKIIKHIQRIQNEISQGPEIEEFVVEQLDEEEDNHEEEIADVAEYNSDEEDTGATEENPYSGIRLEEIININRIFKRTVPGQNIMETLKQGLKPNDKVLTQIKNVLCDYLRSSYGAKQVTEGTSKTEPQELLDYDEPEENVEELIGELKFLCPTPKTQPRAEELWMKTFNERDRVRKSGEFHKYLEDFPVATCFDGKLLKLDFQKLYPAAPKFWDRFEDLKPKVLTTYSSTLQHIGNETIRTLGIIRLKNPTRGM